MILATRAHFHPEIYPHKKWCLSVWLVTRALPKGSKAAQLKTLSNTDFNSVNGREALTSETVTWLQGGRGAVMTEVFWWLKGNTTRGKWVRRSKVTQEALHMVDWRILFCWEVNDKDKAHKVLYRRGEIKSPTKTRKSSSFKFMFTKTNPVPWSRECESQNHHRRLPTGFSILLATLLSQHAGL